MSLPRRIRSCSALFSLSCICAQCRISSSSGRTCAGGAKIAECGLRIADFISRQRNQEHSVTQSNDTLSLTELAGFTASIAFFFGMLSHAGEKKKIRLFSEPTACSNEAGERSRQVCLTNFQGCSGLLRFREGLDQSIQCILHIRGARES